MPKLHLLLIRRGLAIKNIDRDLWTWSVMNKPEQSKIIILLKMAFLEDFKLNVSPSPLLSKLVYSILDDLFKLIELDSLLQDRISFLNSVWKMIFATLQPISSILTAICWTLHIVQINLDNGKKSSLPGWNGNSLQRFEKFDVFWICWKTSNIPFRVVQTWNISHVQMGPFLTRLLLTAKPKCVLFILHKRIGFFASFFILYYNSDHIFRHEFHLET